MATRIRALVAAGILMACAWAVGLLPEVNSLGATAVTVSVPASDRSKAVGFGHGAVAPRYVTGYSYEAQKRMSQRGVSSNSVEDALFYSYKSAKWQGAPKNTWLYKWGKITVAANDDGYVATVWR